MSTEPPLPPADPAARGQSLLDSGDAAGALALFDQALAATPSRGMLHFDRGRALQALERWEEAIRAYTESLRLWPDEFTAYRNRATCRTFLADHEGAAEDLQRYVDHRADRPEVWLDLGDRLLDSGKFARAAEAYEKAIALDAKRAESTQPRIGRARTLERTRTDGPPHEFAAACRERGWAKLDAAWYRTAAIWFNRAIDSVPDDADAWHGRGVARGNLGNSTEALADIEKAAKFPDATPATWVDLASYRSLTGNVEGALAAADEALKRKPEYGSAYAVRGLVNGKLGRLAEAEADLNKAIELVPNHFRAWLNRGWVRCKAKRPREAAEDLTRAIELDPKEPLVYLNRGYARRDLGDTSGADADFRKALALDPSMSAELTPLLQPAAVPPAATTTPSAPVATSPAVAVVPVKSLPSPPPSPLPAPSSWSEFMVFAIILGIVVLVTVYRVPYLSALPARAADIPYKAGWIVLHWNDEKEFPPESKLCMEPFCTRVDTSKKHVCGRPQYTSEIKWRYCPEHEADWIRTDTRLDHLLVVFYWIFSLVLGFVLLVFAMLLITYLFSFPFLLVKVLTGEKPVSFVSPTGLESGFRSDKIEGFSISISMILGIIMLVMYLIW